MKALAILVVAVVSCLASASLEAPRMGTVLADSAIFGNLKPSLILGHGNEVFFTGTGSSDCVGLGLYRLTLTPSAAVSEISVSRNGEALKTPLCVQTLFTRRGKIQVRHRLANSFALDILEVTAESATLNPVIGPALKFKGSGVWNWTRAYLKQQNQWPEDIVWHGFDFIEGQSIRLIGVNSLNQFVYLAVSLNARNDAPLAVPVSLGEIPAGYTADIRFATDSQIVAVLRSEDPKKLARIFLWDLESQPISKKEIGHDFAYVRRTIWDETPLDDWSARTPQAVALAPEGLLIGDSTSFANEKPLLALIPIQALTESQPSPVVKRIKGLHQDWMSGLKAAAVFKAGLLLVFESPSLIAYVGEKNPFSEDAYPTRRADLQEIGVSEYQKLLQEVDSK